MSLDIICENVGDAPKFIASVGTAQRSEVFLERLPQKSENYIIVSCSAYFPGDQGLPGNIAIEILPSGVHRLLIKAIRKSFQQTYINDNDCQNCIKMNAQCTENTIRIYNVPCRIDTKNICAVRLEITICLRKTESANLIHSVLSITQIYYKETLLLAIKNATCYEPVFGAIVKGCARFGIPLEIAYMIMSFIDVVYIRDYFSELCDYT